MHVIRTLLLGLILAALVACSSRPPGCADKEVMTVLRNMLTEPALSPDASRSKDDPGGLIAKFIGATKIELFNVVDDGYRVDAKKQSCKGTLKVSLPNGEVINRELIYATQRTVDDKNNFLLEVQEGGLLAGVIANEAFGQYDKNRWQGDWTGDYTCKGVGGAKDGPQGPFSMQVTLVVAEGSGSLERLTHGGGFEKLKGSLSETSMSLAGEGRNGPDDFWRTAFTGKFSGTTFVAEGGLVSDFGAAVRSCSLNLSHGAPVSPNTSQLIDPASIAGSYAGSGEGGQVTMVIEPKGQDGKFPVQLSTKVTEGGCGGGASGWATYAGTQLSIVAEADGNRCHVQGTVGAKGIELEEGDGCLRFHGAACGFSASLIRSK